MVILLVGYGWQAANKSMAMTRASTSPHNISALESESEQHIPICLSENAERQRRRRRTRGKFMESVLNVCLGIPHAPACRAFSLSSAPILWELGASTVFLPHGSIVWVKAVPLSAFLHTPKAPVGCCSSAAEDKVGMMMSSQLKAGPAAPPFPTKAVGGSAHDRPLLPFSSLSISPSLRPLLFASPLPPSSRLSMRLASPKQAYICRDCGYIYNDRTPFEKLSDSYFCPVCSAPKRRFKAYEPAVSKNANEKEVRKARKAQIQRDESIGRVLPIGIAVGVVGLAGLYVYLNSIF